MTSRVSSSKQDKVRQGVSQVILHFPIIKLQRTPTQKTPPLDSLNHTSSCPQRQRAASSTKLKLLLNTTDLRFRATRNDFATDAEPHLQPATNKNHSTNYITNLCNPCGSDSTDPATQTSKDVRHEGTRGPCSDTNCECEKRLTSRVSSSKQAHVRPGTSKTCCKHLNFSLYRTPTPKMPTIDNLAPILFPPAPTSSTKLKQIHNTTDARSSATHNHFATNFSCNQPTHHRQPNLPTTAQPTQPSVRSTRTTRHPSC